MKTKSRKRADAKEYAVPVLIGRLVKNEILMYELHELIFMDFKQIGN